MEPVFMLQDLHGFCIGGVRTNCPIYKGLGEGDMHDLIRRDGAGMRTRIRLPIGTESVWAGPRFDAGMKPGMRKTQTLIEHHHFDIDATRHVRNMSPDVQAEAGGPEGQPPRGHGQAHGGPLGNRSAL